jgi:hypothetical protein
MHLKHSHDVYVSLAMGSRKSPYHLAADARSTFCTPCELQHDCGRCSLHLQLPIQERKSRVATLMTCAGSGV